VIADVSLLEQTRTHLAAEHLLVNREGSDLLAGRVMNRNLDHRFHLRAGPVIGSGCVRFAAEACPCSKRRSGRLVMPRESAGSPLVAASQFREGGSAFSF